MRPPLTRRLPGIECWADAAPSGASGRYARHIFMFDVPRLLGLSPFPDLSGVAPLPLDVPLRESLRARYRAEAGDLPVVGVAWASGNPYVGGHRSVGIDDLAPLFALDAAFLSLQYGARAAEASGVVGRAGRRLIVDAAIDQMRDLDGFAAQIAACDAVVTIDNTTAHVAGAWGLRATVLLPAAGGLAWYWGASGERTPWYDTLALLRQERPGDWAAPVARAIDQVRDGMSRRRFAS